MLETILVPLDGSVASELAVSFAEAIVRASGAKVILIRAVGLEVPSLPGAGTFNTDLRAGAERELADVQARLTETGVVVEVLIWNDEAGHAIVEAAEERRADLIVMSTHGRTGLGRVMYGSVADEVLRTAPVPVLLVPPAAQCRLDASRRIVVSLDGSALAENAIAPAIDLAEALRAKVVLVRAAEPPTYWVVDDRSPNRVADPDSEVEAARRYLEAVAGRYTGRNVDVSSHATDGPPAQVILDAARDFGAGAIAMATHGRSGLGRMVMGSVAEQVLQATRVPLLLVNAAGSQQQRDASEQALTSNAPSANGA